MKWCLRHVQLNTKKTKTNSKITVQSIILNKPPYSSIFVNITCTSPNYLVNPLTGVSQSSHQKAHDSRTAIYSWNKYRQTYASKSLKKQPLSMTFNYEMRAGETCYMLIFGLNFLCPKIPVEINNETNYNI